MVGSNNRLAHAAALSVAERPGHSYNPLFVYGGSGLGRHLMHAIGHAVISRIPRSASPMRRARSSRTSSSTRSAVRRARSSASGTTAIDVLLIDDIQFLTGKERTQEEFFHTFNAIHEEGKQIVLSSDRPPKAIERLEDRLRSRFEWGLIADISTPDLETRIAILRAKAEAQSVAVPPPVIDFLAQRIVSNIRELEGALTRIVAYATLSAVPVTTQLAQEMLREHPLQPAPEDLVAGPHRRDRRALLRRAVRPATRQGRDKQVVLRGRSRCTSCAKRQKAPLMRIGETLAAATTHGPARLREDRTRDGGNDDFPPGRRSASRDALHQ